MGCRLWGGTESDMTEVTTRMHKDTSILYLGSKITADGDCSHEIMKDAIRAAESVLFNRLSGQWSSADQAADRCLTSG